MGHKAEVVAPFWTGIATIMVFFFMYIYGHFRELFRWKRNRKGYVPLRGKADDFYQRRFYGRIYDLWNRPICSAPDAWIDVMERTDIEGDSGFWTDRLELTGGSKRCLNLASYNYLGFAASDPYCTPQVLDTLECWGVSTCSSRVDGGSTSIHDELEALVADFVGKEAALTYGMGYATNTATIPALVGKGCLILSDSLNHASIAAGCKASGAKVKVFRHNDVRHLESLLRASIAEGQPRTHRPWRKVLIIVEGIYSMEGEVCCLADIVALKNKYRAYLYLDEAHSIGALGARGRGVTEHCGVDPADVDVMMGTFTKSFGSCGGYVAGSAQLIDHIKRRSPAHLYATSMSPSSATQIIAALRLMRGEDGTNRGLAKIRQLHDNANYMRRRLMEMGMEVLGDWDSPIMPVMVYHASKMTYYSRRCLDRGLALVAVSFPATPLLLSRMRLCISAAHSREDLDYALEVMGDVADDCMLKYNSKAVAGGGSSSSSSSSSSAMMAAAAAAAKQQQAAGKGGCYDSDDVATTAFIKAHML